MSCQLKQENYHLSILFKHILIQYLDATDYKSILNVLTFEKFDIAILLGIDLRYSNDYALVNACKGGRLPVVQYLVENSADIHADGDEALICASECGHLQVVQYLVEKGADIHALNDSSLIHATEYCHLPIVKYLVEKGAHKYVFHDAIKRAKNQGFLEIAQYLIDNINK